MFGGLGYGKYLNRGHVVLARILIVIALAWVATPAQAAWLRATTPHFIVYSEGKPEAVRAFAEKIERFDAVLRLVSGLKAPASPAKVTIFVVRSESQVQSYLGKNGRNIAGFYAANISGSIAVIPQSTGSNGGEFDLDSETVLFHEYAHHFMLQYFPAGYPAWYVEGFAEYQSTVDFKRDGSVWLGYPAKHRFYTLVLGPVFPVTRLLAADQGKMSEADTSGFYAWSWLLTHYLFLSPDRKGQIGKYLTAFNNGVDPLVAAKDAFGDLAKLQKDLTAYRDGRFTYMQLKTLTMDAPTIDIVPLSEAEGALMPLYIRFNHGSESAAAVASFAADARKAAALYPTQPIALELLAEGELDAKQFDAASKANEALLAQKPGDARALLRRARIAIGRIGDDNDPAKWKAARQLVVTANRALPDDPFPLMTYYRTFMGEGREPPTIALDGLLRAQELAPQVSDLRIMLAQRLIQLKRHKDAEIVLAPLLNDPHSAALRQIARAILDDTGPPAPKPGADQAAKTK